MKRSLIPVIAVVAMLTILGLLYGGKAYNGWLFSRSCNSMLDEFRKGKIDKVGGFIMSAQQQSAEILMQNYLPPDYQNRIRSLKLTSWRWNGDDQIIALVTCRYEEDGFNAIYQGKLYWRLKSRKWQWDFFESSVASFSAAEQQDWVKLGDIQELMERY